jgi:hypothetical protein
MRHTTSLPPHAPLPMPPGVFQAGHVVVVELPFEFSIEVLLLDRATEARILWEGFEVRRLTVGCA